MEKIENIKEQLDRNNEDFSTNIVNENAIGINIVNRYKSTYDILELLSTKIEEIRNNKEVFDVSVDLYDMSYDFNIYIIWMEKHDSLLEGEGIDKDLEEILSEEMLR